jgi:hypothetical protein
MPLMRSFFALLMIIMLADISYGQVDFRTHEDSLKRMMNRIAAETLDSEKLSLNEQFKEYFEKVLRLQGSMAYPFDSLRTVSRLSTPDGSFRIISWYIPLSESQFDYFGFFQSRLTKNEIVLHELTDKALDTEEPSFAGLSHQNWYGAWYTHLIHEKHRNKDYYLLLGWRGDNALTRKRIIEPVKVMGKGRPAFGEPVFRFENNRYKRIIFEYSAKVSMSMRYEPHIIGSSRRPQQVIIFDRMAPMHDFLTGHYQFYVPETNIFDGFVFEEGRWIFVKDIDAKNPNRRPVPRPTAPRN